MHRDEKPPVVTPSSLPYIGRFAPSPTGPLHWGSALAAFGSWLHARHHGGQWLVRIEDLDPPRERPEAAAHQLATLERLGLHPDGDVLFQSQRSAVYRAALDRLIASGAAFPCRCSRTDLVATGGIHRACVALPDGARRTRSFRLRVDDRPRRFTDPVQGEVVQRLLSEVGDVVLRRADGYWAYQLAVVVDDGEQRISHVVRGADLLDSTLRQMALQEALGLPTPAYLHLPLWRDAEGRKLSKSEGAETLDAVPADTALRRCWAALDQPADLLPAPGGTVSELLDTAARGFDPSLIPKERPLAR